MSDYQRKYDVRFCKCGAIHLIPWEKIEKAVNEDKVLMMVCMSGGEIYYIGADKSVDEDGNPQCNMFTLTSDTSPDTFSIDAQSFRVDGTHDREISEIYFSKGIRPLLDTGYLARGRDTVGFLDVDYKRASVNMQYLYDKQIPEDARKDVMGYLVNGLDWDKVNISCSVD